MAFVGPVDDSRRYTVPDGAQPEGSGGQGFVYRATRTADGAPVALKCLTRVDLDDWPRLVDRARLVAEVAHPSLGRQLDAFLGPHPFAEDEPTDDEFDEAYVVAAWVEGRELTEAAAGADLATVLGWVREVGLAADALHHHPGPGSAGIVHRDIKPSNVIVGRAGAVLVDFGVARPTDGSTATVGVGSPGWLPPEAYDDPGKVGPSSDLWQVAGLASWAVDGQAPGRRDAGRHRQHLARVLTGRGVGSPRRLAAHIDAGLAPRPADRPADLRRWCDELAALAAPAPASRPRRSLAAAAAIAAVVALIAGAGFVYQERSAADSTGAAEPADQGQVLEVPPSITSDGTRDVGAELSGWLATVIQEQRELGQPLTVTFSPNGRYRVDDAAVLMTDAADLTLDFQGATLERTRVLDQSLRWPHRNGFLRLDAPRKVTVQNLEVLGVNNNNGSMVRYADGEAEAKPYLLDAEDNQRAMTDNDLPDGDWGIDNAALALEHGIHIDDGVGVTVQTAKLAGMGGDGVSVTGGRTDGVTIRKVTQRRNGGQGISVSAGKNVLIEDNDLMSAGAGILIEPEQTDRVVRNIEVRNNQIQSTLHAFASGGPGEIHGVNIHHNTILKSATPVLFAQSSSGVKRRTGYKFDDNTVTQDTDSAQPLVQLGNVHDSQVMRNVIPRAAGSCSQTAVGLTVKPSTGILVADNTFAGAVPPVQDIVGGSNSADERNATGPQPAVPLIPGNVLGHQMQDFENSTSRCWKPSPENLSVVHHTGDAYRGTGAVKLTVPAGLSGFAMVGFGSQIPTGPDRTVTAEGAIKGLDADPVPYVLYRFNDARGDAIGPVEIRQVSGSPTPLSWWTFTGSPVRTPAGTVNVDVAFGVFSHTEGHRYLFDHLEVSSRP